MLHLFNFFHLNLAYSAIEEEDRPRVIEKCYWPLLRLARRHNLPFGIELSGYTLEVISELDPSWVDELTSLVNDGPCELIGCGYAQVIGPLVPAEVTAANLQIGHQVYEEVLGCRPRIALLNEQAFSAGMVPLYSEAGYDAIIMEWNNPARSHPEWDPEWRYLPQRALGPGDESIPLIWNKSIAFQKFQRYVHGELELDELLAYVRSHKSSNVRAFPLYGNDVEIFDFRPGRYMTEAPLHGQGEWARIDRLYEALLSETEVQFVLPSTVLTLNDEPDANNLLRLETSSQPIPVKKQDKYNVVRWAVTGRNDLDINTRCWRIYKHLQDTMSSEQVGWKELCYLWSSDFRTHITVKRWNAYLLRLTSLEGLLGINRDPADQSKLDLSQQRSTGTVYSTVDGDSRHAEGLFDGVRVERQGRILSICGKRLQVRLNCSKGLALESFVDLHVSEKPLCGTLHHGYFDDIRWGADYYSGHLVLEMPGRHKVTDLVAVEPEVEAMGDGIKISATIETQLGSIEKTWLLNEKTGSLASRVKLHFEQEVIGALRIGHFTLIPDSFDLTALRCRTHNGGRELETFMLNGKQVDQGRAVSFLVSANQALGVTGGVVELSYGNIGLRVSLDKHLSNLVGMLTHQQIGGSCFTRIAFSAMEVDDTSRPGSIGLIAMGFELQGICLDRAWT